jgi:hypothetical protein
MKLKQTAYTALSVLFLSTMAIAAPGPKHTVVEKLTNVGPEAKRQGSYMLEEVLQFFVRIDKIMKTDDVTKTHMDNAFGRAVSRSVDNWTERRAKVQKAYFAWAKQRGRTAKSMPDDWKAYFKNVADFLTELAQVHGSRAVQWKRDLNTVNKKFAKYVKTVPKAIKLYKSDIDYADKELAAAKATLDKSVAKLDDLKQHARHLKKVLTTVKNLQRHMVDQQEKAKETMGDKAFKPATFQKGLTLIEKWRDAAAANDKLHKNFATLPTHWATYAKKTLDDYKKNYADLEKTMTDFMAGDIFDGSEFFRGVEYGKMVDVVEQWRTKVAARIKKITGS